ncbi:receptor-like cytosolic serine/threonine-protein kinase RBK2 isoform X2 [Punica granatum]|uniref:non-specific serine/threonine protein kinase n=1 Tax=Punica granatum TaxID=22663 RepID=A0A6P8C7V8_PUNGR|nr:receptor-like cytosolic serine/threonine-protein kinase RBK2 isoform X2 [Punica granatum]
MVDDKVKMGSGSSFPYYAGLHLHVLSFGEHDEEYCKVPIKVLVGPGKTKNRLALLSASASAQDLRTLEMEKEKKDGASPRGVLEACMNCSGSVPPSAKNSSEKSAPVSCTGSKSLSRWGKFFKLWKRRSIMRLASFPPLTITKMSKGKSGSEREEIPPVLSEIYNFKSTLEHFSLSDLAAATNNFSPDNLIGKGGYAYVYKGRLQNGKYVAVKKLTKGSADERTASFLSELGIIAHVNHPNTAKLIGCGVEGGMHLVFQLSPLGSLGSILHGSKSKVKLDWCKRYKIALGTANGLVYLHESCRKRIIHRDIKADNILLTEDFEPQICDFGLAKWLPKQWTHHNVSRFEGTFGYFAPEYFMHGIVDEKTDVYAFGVLLLELITGRKALDHLQRSVVLWAKPLLDENAVADLVDPSLGDEYDPEEMDWVIMTASLCIEQSPILRPRMHQVVVLLKGDQAAAEDSEEWPRKSVQRTYSEELLDAQEYNSTRYLSDLRRHREVALGS